MQETQVQSLIWEDPLEKEMTIHSSILAWKIPWTEQPDRLQSECHKESDPIEHAHAHTHVHPYYPGVYFLEARWTPWPFLLLNLPTHHCLPRLSAFRTWPWILQSSFKNCACLIFQSYFSNHQNCMGWWDQEYASKGKLIPTPPCALVLISKRSLLVPSLLHPPHHSEWVFLGAPSQTPRRSSSHPFVFEFCHHITVICPEHPHRLTQIGWICIFQLKWFAASTARCRLAVELLHAWKTPPVTQMGCMTSVNPSCTALLNLTLR